MSLLLDTHIVLWWLADRARLTATTIALIQDPANRVFVSIATVWEMAIKESLGRLTIPDEFLSSLDACGIELLPISEYHALAVANLPPIHKDPFDRMLVAQAMHEGLTLVTRDPLVMAYPVATLQA